MNEQDPKIPGAIVEGKQTLDLGLTPGDKIIFAHRTGDKKAIVLEITGETVKIQVKGEQYPRLITLEPIGDGKFRFKKGGANVKLFEEKEVDY